MRTPSYFLGKLCVCQKCFKGYFCCIVFIGIMWSLVDTNTGLFEMIVGVLTTCHTQYTWDSSIYIFLFNRTTLQVFVTYRTGTLYVHPLWFYKHQCDNQVHSKLFVACQWWWFQWRFWFVPSIPGYLREEEEHSSDFWRNPVERNHMGLHLENKVKTLTVIFNDVVYFPCCLPHLVPFTKTVNWNFIKGP
jgi:hypothetical protein